MKRCNRCKALKPLSEYAKMSASPDGHQYKCRPCSNEVKRQWEQENRERARAYQRNGDIRRYGIEPEEYDRLLVEQSNVCAICHCPDPRGHRLHIDHCHATGRVRGLLCGPCNRGIGMFKDSITLLHRAAEYLALDADPVAAVTEHVVQASNFN